MKSEILAALYRGEDYVSGQELCDSLHVSRTAIWKVINQLKEEGYVIESVPRRGYRILERPDCVTAEEIQSRLTTKLAGRRVVSYETIDSTNNEAKRLAEAGAEDGTLVVAEQQVQGKGRRGRSWVVPAHTSVMMSLLLRPQIRPEHASSVTLVMGLAVAKACRQFSGIETRIKWPNDVVVDGKKICGILTEMSSEIDYINYLVIGAGINANLSEFPEELREKATSLYLLTGRQTDRAGLIAACMEQFESCYEKFLRTQDVSLLQEEYNELLAGRDTAVRVLEPGHEYTGISRGINARGELLVEKEDGTVEQVYAGEVSVRGIYGYV